MHAVSIDDYIWRAALTIFAPSPDKRPRIGADPAERATPPRNCKSTALAATAITYMSWQPAVSSAGNSAWISGSSQSACTTTPPARRWRCDRRRIPSEAPPHRPTQRRVAESCWRVGVGGKVMAGFSVRCHRTVVAPSIFATAPGMRNTGNGTITPARKRSCLLIINEYAATGRRCTCQRRRNGKFRERQPPGIQHDASPGKCRWPITSDRHLSVWNQRPVRMNANMRCGGDPKRKIERGEPTSKRRKAPSRCSPCTKPCCSTTRRRRGFETTGADVTRSC